MLKYKIERRQTMAGISMKKWIIVLAICAMIPCAVAHAAKTTTKTDTAGELADICGGRPRPAWRCHQTDLLPRLRPGSDQRATGPISDGKKPVFIMRKDGR